MNKVILAIVAVLVVIFGLSYGFTHQQPVTPADQQASTDTDNQVYGSIPGNTLPDCFTSAGIQTCHTSMALRAATSTYCALKSPAATSTLSAATVRIGNQSLYSGMYELGLATTPYATTTLLARITSSGSFRGPIVATSTSLQDNIVPPNSYIVLKAGSTTMSTLNVPTGLCEGIFRII